MCRMEPHFPVVLQGRNASFTIRKVAREAVLLVIVGSADFVRRFADLGDLMRLYSEPELFDETLEAAAHVS